MSASRRGEGPSPPAPRPAVGAGHGGLWREQPHPLVQPLLLQSLPPRVLISRAAQLRKPPPTSASPQAPTARPGGSGEQASTLEVATKGQAGPAPHSWATFFSFNPTSVSPSDQKTGQDETPPHESGSGPSGVLPAGASAPSDCPEPGWGLPSQGRGLCLPKTLSLPSSQRPHRLQPGKWGEVRTPAPVRVTAALPTSRQAVPGVPRGVSSRNSLGAGTTVIRVSHTPRKLARVTLNPTLTESRGSQEGP